MILTIQITSATDEHPEDEDFNGVDLEIESKEDLDVGPVLKAALERAVLEVKTMGKVTDVTYFR